MKSKFNKTLEKLLKREDLWFRCTLVIIGLIYLLLKINEYIQLREVGFATADSYAMIVKSITFMEEGFSVLGTRPFLMPVLIGFVHKYLITDIFVATYLLTSIIFVASVFALDYLGKKIFKSKFSRLVLLSLVLFSKYFLIFSSDAEKAPFVVGFFVIGLLLWTKGRENGRMIFIVLAGLLFGLSFMSHLTALLLFVSFGVGYLVEVISMKKKLFSKEIFVLAGVVLIFGVSFYFVRKYIVKPDMSTSDVSLVTTAVQYNLLNSFSKIGLMSFIHGITFYMNRYVLLVGVLGFIYVLFSKKIFRNSQVLYLASWVSVTFFLFSIQYTSFSHGSRYPYYVIFPMLVFVAVFIDWVASYFKSSRMTTLFQMLVVVWILVTYVDLNVSDFRYRWQPHKELCEYFRDEGEGYVDNMMYVSWPSITLYCFDGNSGVADQNTNIGWNRSRIDLLNDKYIIENKLIYLLVDYTGNDYSDTNERILKNVSSLQEVTPVFEEEFTDDRGNFRVILYSLNY
ncbi:hypothetical protein JW710_02560 [Candidatus Dojkabacteria bacterium]|nr:hypothetical protein [Candidatus Dojkabacteria bacterium]